MRDTFRNLLISLLVGGFFFWLALRNVPFDTLLGYMQGISYGWTIPYTLVALFSHYVRAERWRLLIRQEGVDPARSTLFAGVMFGYLVNYAVPRLGEVSRCAYVAKKEEISGTNLLGTVILERFIDLLVMLAMFVFISVALFSDIRVLANVFGEETINYLVSLINTANIIAAISAMIFLFILGYLSLKLIRRSAPERPWIESVIKKFKEFGAVFIDGLLSVRRVKQWPYFILLTMLVWLGYVLLTYIPFFALNLHETYGLGFVEAMVIMALSTIGIALPSPGGIGTYHWFVRQGLVVLYGVPAAIGLAYAFISHAVMMGVVLLSTPFVLIWNSWYSDRK